MLDYCATFQQSKVCYCAYGMVLHVDSNVGYLVTPHAKSREAGCFQLNNEKYPTNPSMPLNGAFLVECKTLCHIVVSSAESETAVTFHNAQCALPIRYILSQLGHPQPPTPYQIDNQITTNFMKNIITQKNPNLGTCPSNGCIINLSTIIFNSAGTNQPTIWMIFSQKSILYDIMYCLKMSILFMPNVPQAIHL